MFKGDEAPYQQIQRLTMEVLVIARMIRPYFPGNRVMIKTNYPFLPGLEETNFSMKDGVLEG